MLCVQWKFERYISPSLNELNCSFSFINRTKQAFIEGYIFNFVHCFELISWLALCPLSCGLAARRGGGGGAITGLGQTEVLQTATT